MPDPDIGLFSGDSSAEGDSAIDLIKAAVDRPSLSLLLASGNEKVTLGALDKDLAGGWYSSITATRTTRAPPKWSSTAGGERYNWTGHRTAVPS
ncbi:MAG: hypothetical protein LBG27_05340 [Spirochaetaceae bacterium]|nr:hypothetical protein [Spirochaetaceae bacterium]